MYTINDDNSIYVTRGDVVSFGVTATDVEGEEVPHHFEPGDILRIKVFGKKDAETVYLEKDFPVLENCERVEIVLTEEDTKFGEIISKPKDYWYEVCLNPDTNPQTIIGYSEDGPVVFRLFPEGADTVDDTIPTEEDIPFVDTALDLTSPRPVSNQAITAAIEKLKRDTKKEYVTPQMFGAVSVDLFEDTLDNSKTVPLTGFDSVPMLVVTPCNTSTDDTNAIYKDNQIQHVRYLITDLTKDSFTIRAVKDAGSGNTIAQFNWLAISL